MKRDAVNSDLRKDEEFQQIEWKITISAAENIEWTLHFIKLEFFQERYDAPSKTPSSASENPTLIGYTTSQALGSQLPTLLMIEAYLVIQLFNLQKICPYSTCIEALAHQFLFIGYRRHFSHSTSCMNIQLYPLPIECFLISSLRFWISAAARRCSSALMARVWASSMADACQTVGAESVLICSKGRLKKRKYGEETD